jgi:hypothetical protein
VLGDLAERHADLLECVREIRRARDLRDLGIVGPAQVERVENPPAVFERLPIPTPTLPSNTAYGAVVKSPHEASEVALIRTNLSAPIIDLPPLAATKRDYNYFAELDAKLALLRDVTDPTVRD